MINRIFLIILSLFITSCDSAVESNNDPLTNLTEFALEDLNQTSSTYGEYISQADYSDNIQVYYFPSHSTWGQCIGWFSLLSSIKDEYLEDNIQVFVAGIAKIDDNSSTDNITNGNSNPYLKDAIVTDSYPNNVWENWGVAQRDVYIIDTNLEWEKLNISGLDDNEAEALIKGTIDGMLE